MGKKDRDDALALANLSCTGRAATTRPNMQRLPGDDPARGRRIRSGFIPPSDQAIAAANYTDIELRVAAHLIGEDEL